MTELLVDPSFPRFSREELVAEMDARFGFSDGAFRRYQELGLVAAPRQDRRWKKGRSGSGEGLWSDHDRRMLIGVLELRERHEREIGGQLQLGKLGNFIVWSWVFRDGFVELDQVRRALRTWVTPQLGGGGAGRARSRTYFERQCRLNVDALAAPGVLLKLRKHLAADLAECFWQNDVEGLTALVDTLDRVIDPQHSRRQVSAPSAGVNAAAEIARLYLTHRAAEAVVTGEPSIPDAQWEAARLVMRFAWSRYTTEWSRLATQTTRPDLFRPPTVDYQIASCSSALLLRLGQQLFPLPAGLGESDLSVWR